MRHDVTAGDGRTIAAYEHGDPQGRAVLSHHGTPGSGHAKPTWIAEAERQGIRLISYDRAGYAGSDRRLGRSVADIAADATAIADALGVERFATWGGSGGGPHALACGALLGERVVAVATIAGAAPSDADDIDFLAGMGEDNITEFNAAIAGEDALRPLLEGWAPGMLEATAEGLVEEMRSLLSPPDVAVITGEFGEQMVIGVRASLSNGVDGWIDDDLAFVKPWGFDVADVGCPVQVWQGEQDLMVPTAHGEWLARHVPGADARISPDDGHLTLTELHLGEVFAFLLAGF
jgi:pimeloyl-ACP methyl ester carboxylesterase